MSEMRRLEAHLQRLFSLKVVAWTHIAEPGENIVLYPSEMEKKTETSKEYKVAMMADSS